MVKDKSHQDTFVELKRALQAFQAERLRNTYTDLRAMPEYEHIGDFFFNRLYAPEDFSFRDASIKKLHSALDGKVYGGMLSAVSRVIELHELSDALDETMVEMMTDLEIGPDMTMDEYIKAYQSLDNFDQRVYQINLGAEVTHDFHRLSQKWMVAISLRTVKTAAMLFDIKQIVDFIYDGYTAFKKIKSIDYFVDTILERELAWHHKIWQGGITDTRGIPQ
ncbi:MAG: hypothetical protein V1793_09615 [Pseudomonadota bacterium]